MEVRRRIAAAPLALAAVFATAPPANPAPAGGPPAGCILHSFSATFSSDGTAMCLGGEQSGDTATFRIYLTRDGGRAWQQRSADNLVFPPGTMLGHTWVSPNYRTDNTLYVAGSTGLWASTDGGGSFALVSNQVGDGGSPNYGLTPYTEPDAFPFPLPGAPTGPHTAFAFASIRDDDARSARLDYPAAVPLPVAGSSGDDERFLVPPRPGNGPAAFALARVAAGDPAKRSDDPYQIFGCTRDLTCQTPLFQFPVARDYLLDAVFAADYATSRTFYLAFQATGAPQRPALWQSTDAGATFRPMAAVTKLLAALPSAPGTVVNIGLAADPVVARRLYLHVGYSISPWRPRLPPAVQLFRSDDRGAHWTRIGYQLGDRQPGIRGSLPWIGTSGFVVAPGAGKLFATGADASGNARLFCSADGGRRWGATCPR